jgi:hypothetical protein
VGETRRLGPATDIGSRLGGLDVLKDSFKWIGIGVFNEKERLTAMVDIK